MTLVVGCGISELAVMVRIERLGADPRRANVPVAYNLLLMRMTGIPLGGLDFEGLAGA